MKKSFLYSAFTVLTILWSSIAHAQIDTVHLRLQNGLDKRGTSYAYPIYCDDSLTVADSVMSGEFILSNNGIVVDVIGFDTVGTLLGGKQGVLFNPSTKKIVFANSIPITGKGVLLYLTFFVKLAASGITPVTLTGAMFNEGKPFVKVTAGSFRPMDIFINPKNPPQNKVVGDSIFFTVSGDITPPIFWSVGDASIAAIDTSGKLVGKKVGQTYAKVVDSYGLTDQSNLIPINSPSLNSLTMTIPDTSFLQNLTFDLPIRVSDVTSLGIISAQWRLNYNTNSLVPKGVFTTGTLAQSWGPPTVNYGLGTMDIAMAGPDTLTGKGVLTYVRFQVKRLATQNSNLDLQNILFNETMTATVDNGIFSPIQGPTITINPNRQILTRGDTVTYFAIGGTPPYKWFSSNSAIASVDSFTGKVQANSRGSFTLSAFDAQGFDGTFNVTVNDFLASLPDTSVLIGGSVDVPIYISDVTGLGIFSNQIKVGYDTTKINFAELITLGTLSSGMISAVKDSGAIIRLAFAGTNPLLGSGIFAKLRFHHKPPSGPGQVSSLTFLEYQNNELSPVSPTTTLKNGKITILQPPNNNPVFTKTMSDTTINEDQQLSFDFDAFDADNDQIKFFLQNQPVGMTMDSMNGSLNWKPNLNQSGIYNFIVAAVDGKGGIASKPSKITVLNTSTNHPPQFTTVLPDTTINANTLFTFQYSASDGDILDTVTFGLIFPQQGSGITVSPKGLLSWTPNSFQIGKNLIIVGVTDGKGGTLDTAIINVQNSNRSPVFTFPPRDTTIIENTLMTMSVKAVDADNDTIIYGLSGAPQGMTIDSLFGTISWRPNFTQVGLHTFDLGAGDKKGLPTKVTVTFTVVIANRPPQFTAMLPDTTVNSNSLLTFQYAASGTNISDSLLFGLFFGPQGVNISPKGLLSWTPNSFQGGKNLIIVGVTDGKSGTLDTAIVTVKNINRPPQFVATLPDMVVPVDTVLNFKYSAVDPDNDNLTFSLTKFPSGASIQKDGLLFWKPTASQIGKDTIIVGVNDGSFTAQDTAVVSVIGFPTVQFSQNNLDFGSNNFGSTKTLSTTVKNTGITPLRLMLLSLPQFNNPDPNFIIDTIGISFIAPDSQKIIRVTYNPKSVGGHNTAYGFKSNDPKNQLFVLSVNGSAISKLAVTKRLLVDTLHNSPVSFSDSTRGITQLFKFFEQSGIQITLTGSDLRPSGNDILLLIAPQKKFTRQEIDSVKIFVSNGGLLVALGNSAKEGNNAFSLNSLLKDTSWTTNLSLDSNLVVDSSSIYTDSLKVNSDASLIMLTTFADAKHPYFANVDTVVFFGSASVAITGTAIPLISTTPKGTTIGAQSRTQPAVAGLSKIGKGKILLLGDADVWGVESADRQTVPNISIKDNLAFAINVFSVTEDYEVKLPNKTFNERYQLVSIPFDLDNSDVASVLKGLGTQNSLTWRLFGHYDPVTMKYAEYPSAKFKSFKRGEAYWLITRGEFGLSLGNSTIVPVQSFYPIKIGPGYSMVGNPFPYKVSWKKSLHDSAQNLIWKYDGETFKAESLALDPFIGYFVKNLSKDSITIYINPEDISNLKKSGYFAAVYNEGEWRIGISAASGKSADDENYAGVMQGATDEFDSYDVAEPPSSPTDYVVIRFQNNSWKEHSGSYAMDFRAISSEGLFWDFDVVTAASQSRVALKLAEFGNIPTDFVIYVVDKTTERVMRIDQSYQYEFTMTKNESRRNFRLIVGKREFIEKNTQGIPLVAVEYALKQNYPNPFNPSTQIRYTLGHSGNISLDIYNILGQRVRSLVNTIQQIGTYELEWDGKDNNGNTVSTGVYFYKLTVISNGEKAFTETKKLMLLK